MFEKKFNDLLSFNGVVYFFEKNKDIIGFLNLKNNTYRLTDTFSDEDKQLISFYSCNFSSVHNSEDDALTINVDKEEKYELITWLKENFHRLNHF